MLTTVAKTEALAAIGTANTKPTNSFQFEGLMTNSSTTGWKSTSEEILEKAAHGLVTGDIVTLSEKSGGSAVVEERIYFVKELSSSTISLSPLVAGTPLIKFGSAITAVKVTKWKEVKEESGYARIACKLEGPSNGSMEDATAHRFKVPAGTIAGISHHSASTAGVLMDIEPVTPAVFAEPGEYEATKSTVDFNAAL